jgi:hypothetical protein
MAAGVLPAQAHDVITTKLTYTREISRILARSCLSCHSTGSTIPLTTYEEARPWAVAIKEQVLSRQMPPWGAVKGFGALSQDLALSEEDILTIAAWVVGGAPQGDPAFLPKQLPAAVQFPAPSAPAIVVASKLVLRQRVSVAGITPKGNTVVGSCQIVAKPPDGRVIPIVWLNGYNPKWPHTFRLRTPIPLPAGTVVEASSPLEFGLNLAPGAPAARR